MRILVFQIQHLIRFLSYIVFKFLDGSLKIQGYKEIQVGMMIMMIMFIHTILGFSECTQRCQISLFELDKTWRSASSSAKEAEKDISLCFQKDWKNPPYF